MPHSLPIILGAGLFDSRERFPARTVTAPRTTQTYELEYFFENSGVSVLNGKAYSIKEGSVLLAKPGDVRYSHLPFQCHFLHFSVQEPFLAAALEGLAGVFHAPDPQKTRKQFLQIISLFCSANPFDNIAGAAELVCLLHQLGSQPGEDLSTVSRAQSFIRSHYRQELSTQAIADTCGVSVSYLHRLFRTALNTTPGEYLLACRLSAARDLLVNTEMALSQIALACGFNTQSYFSVCFKKAVGMSPKDFRKNATYCL